ncbi:MAG: hypothetical protein N3D84_01025, partial [Candidatus Woesearchaeota archaeon]|nr:hypothetical protein [Candidatus Woesearchaeota archaeon]
GPVHYEHIKNLEKKTKLEIFTASSFSKNSKPDLFIEKTIDARQFIEKKAVDIIYGLESSNERDKLGYRLSGLNHTLCQMASERKKIIGFDFSSVLN